jgi:hypothetical protein
MSTFHYGPGWHFADSEEGLCFYVLTDAGFQKELNVSFRRLSHHSKVCLLYTKQRLWNQVGVRKEFMNALCSDWNIPLEFWQQFWDPEAAGFYRHYTFDEDESTSAKQLQSIDIGFRWVAGGAGFINVFAHYNVATSQILLVVREGEDLDQKPLLDILQAHIRLSQRPLESIGLLLMASCNFIVTDTLKCGTGVSTMELSLELSVDTHRLQRIGYSKSYRTLSEENKVLYSLQKRIAANARSYGFITSICKYYMNFAAHLQDQHSYQIPVEHAEDVIRRLSIDNSYILYLDKTVQTQFTVLYNMILREDAKVSIAIAATSKTIAEATRKDSSAMKTIAYLTLAFLPTAIVSSIFSTTILDFQNWSSSNSAPRVVSSGWWVYALTCGLATAITLLIYFVWPVKWSPTRKRQVPDVEMADHSNADHG